MTALDQYERLESEGLWRETKDAQRRDTVVSFGNATLVISDAAGRPLTHWSLPAIVRLNEGTRPALFAPQADADETLEIADELMIDAIEKVRKTLLTSRPKKGKLRSVLITAGVVGFAALAVFWFPGAVREQTLGVVPASKRAEIDAAILQNIRERAGPFCANARGRAALQSLATRLFDTEPRPTIVATSSAVGGAVVLPGGTIVIDKSTFETVDEPAITAGYILAAQARADAADPLGKMIDGAGIQPTLKFLTTGDLAAEHIAAHANALIGRAAPNASPKGLEAIAQDAKVNLVPYLSEVGGPEAPTDYETEIVLHDNAWVSLQGICD